MTSPSPLYTPANTNPAHRLYWVLDLFWHTPPVDASWLHPLTSMLRPHGIRIFRHRCTQAGATQFLLKTRPDLSPQRFTRLVKGNLQALLRPQRTNAFRRNYGFRSVGSSKRTVVERYVIRQIPHHRFVDPRFEAFLSRFQIQKAETDLSLPQKTAHSRYWYNLHIVLVNKARWRERREERLAILAEWIPKICRGRGMALAAAGILPDHAHVAVGVGSDKAPGEVALCLMNNLAYGLGMKPVFQRGYFVATFGEYDLGVFGKKAIVAPPK